jgi:hypothetical protein
MKITDFGAFLRFKKQIVTTYSLWERAYQKTPDQNSSELKRQLIDFQLVSVKNLKDGLLRTELSNDLTQLLRKFNSGNLINSICFMDSIEDVFEEQGQIGKLAGNRHYLVCVDGHARAWIKHPKVATIGTSNPADKSDIIIIMLVY